MYATNDDYIFSDDIYKTILVNTNHLSIILSKKIIIINFNKHSEMKAELTYGKINKETTKII